MTKTTQSSGAILFAKQAFNDFGAFGSFIPTSKYTARQMVQPISAGNSGYVVELGAGNGVVTAALQEHLTDPSRIVAIEQSLELSKHLKQRFPSLTILQGDAAELQTLLGNKANQVSAVISTLPFCLIDDETGNKILSTIRNLLPEDGQLVQITYSWRKQHHPAFSKYFTLKKSSKVWLNIPPARVDVYARS